MSRIYRSKVDTWLVAVLVPAMVAAGVVGLMAFAAGTLVAVSYGAFIVAVGVALPWWLLRATHYTFAGGALVIRSGPFKWRVPVAEITHVSPTSNPLSSPALSLDRLRIEYGRKRWIMISPLDREDFLRELEMRRNERPTNLEHA